MLAPVTLKPLAVSPTQTVWLPEAVPPNTSGTTVICTALVVAVTVHVVPKATLLNKLVWVSVPTAIVVLV